MIERPEFGPATYGQGSGPWQGPGEVIGNQYAHTIFYTLHKSVFSRILILTLYNLM